MSDYTVYSIIGLFAVLLGYEIACIVRIWLTLRKRERQRTEMTAKCMVREMKEQAELEHLWRISR